mmetsp:Transcript_34278/g.90162  ORF Transcript_34278/g.90162 Transcript_34278/m.90162 type:complete len:214 (-) Transcript_34278:16-657(-)
MAQILLCMRRVQQALPMRACTFRQPGACCCRGDECRDSFDKYGRLICDHGGVRLWRCLKRGQCRRRAHKRDAESQSFVHLRVDPSRLKHGHSHHRPTCQLALHLHLVDEAELIYAMGGFGPYVGCAPRPTAMDVSARVTSSLTPISADPKARPHSYDPQPDLWMAGAQSCPAIVQKPLDGKVVGGSPPIAQEAHTRPREFLLFAQRRQCRPFE